MGVFIETEEIPTRRQLIKNSFSEADLLALFISRILGFLLSETIIIFSGRDGLSLGLKYFCPFWHIISGFNAVRSQDKIHPLAE